MKNKKLYKIIIPIFIAIILIIIILFKLFTSYSFTLYLNWGVKIPLSIDYSITYEKDSGESFHGDGVFYDVLSYENEKAYQIFSTGQQRHHLAKTTK